MGTVRALYKIFLYLVIIVLYLITSILGRLFIWTEKGRRHFYTENVSFFTRIANGFMNIKVIAKNLPDKKSNYLFVGNHMGMLDILAISAIKPALFITSVEMQKTPGLGLICEMGGCLFVERRNRSNIHNEIDQIRGALQQGLNVILYPEGTSTNGEKVWPFKKSLLTAAAGTGVPIKPMVVNYTVINGEPMSDKYRDYVCWYGDQSFFPAMWRMFSLKSVVAEIEFLDEIHVHSEEERRHVAGVAHSMIENKFKPIVKPSSAE